MIGMKVMRLWVNVTFSLCYDEAEDAEGDVDPTRVSAHDDDAPGSLAMKMVMLMVMTLGPKLRITSAHTIARNAMVYGV